jgi:DNA mismatch repair protein MutL
MAGFMAGFMFGISAINEYNTAIMGQIKALDRNMINMIAAGEVIERPASVVKELVENSIDAGATKIIITIEDGGRKLISVRDNGCGMDADDLSCAFESHTTSKIKTGADLHRISTLGFRGEALASIASVALVKAVSRAKESSAASCIEIDCGEKNTVHPCSSDYGTTIEVRDIFYKLPARRKFLRTANTEMSHITEQFTRFSLANTNLDLTLSHNGRELYHFSEKNDLRQRIARLFPTASGGSFEDMIELQSSEKSLHIFALLGKPEISRTNNNFQYVFLNGRFIHDKFISHAIKEAYRGLLEPNRFPVVFLFVQMPTEDFDVNVHPTKIEVRFYNSNFVHSQILGAMREKLLGTNLNMPAQLPPITNRQNTQPVSALVPDKRISDAMSDFFKRHKFQSQQPISYSGKRIENQTAKSYTMDARFLQIHDSFIVVQTKEGFSIIDQHALHERIIYEDLRRRIRTGKLQSQRLLMPESFELSEAKAEMLQKNSELMEKLGIEIVPFARRTLAIQAFPSILAKVPPLEFIRDLIDLFDSPDVPADTDRLLEKILDMAACKAAIKAGQKLTNNEIEQLLADKHLLESASRCPHGRPTTIEFTISELEKQFKRT